MYAGEEKQVKPIASQTTRDLNIARSNEIVMFWGFGGYLLWLVSCSMWLNSSPYPPSQQEHPLQAGERNKKNIVHRMNSNNKRVACLLTQTVSGGAVSSAGNIFGRRALCVCVCVWICLGLNLRFVSRNANSPRQTTEHH